MTSITFVLNKRNDNTAIVSMVILMMMSMMVNMWCTLQYKCIYDENLRCGGVYYLVDASSFVSTLKLLQRWVQVS